MKRLSIALAALGLSAGALAALPAATDPTVVNVPLLPGGFVIGVGGYFLQPSDSNGDLDYATVNGATVATNGATSTFASRIENVEPGYDWGWDVNVGYIFPQTGNDVNLKYFQLDTSDTASVGANTGDFLLPVNAGTVLGNNNDWNASHSKAEYDINQVDLTFGQYINVGCRLVLHPNVGLRWADLERKLNTGFTAPALASTALVSTNHTSATSYEAISDESDFEGIGPILGLDASYYIGMGFGAVGHFDSALLVGNIDATQGVNASNGSDYLPATGPVITDGYSKTGDTRRVVPVADMKLGLDYTYVFNNAANSDLTMELGWQFSNYFNAVDKINSVSGLVASRGTSDFGLNGPYLRLEFHA